MRPSTKLESILPSDWEGTTSSSGTLEERYTKGRELGAGGFGTVYEVTRLSDGQQLAAKTARKTKKTLKRALEEARVWS
eukprot:3346339-Prymnesium_polylepis.1